VAEAVYLDTCVLNRPSDDHSQPRIREEAEALGRILDLVYEGRIRWYSSNAVRFEIEQNPDPVRRIRALDLLSSASQTIGPQSNLMAEAIRLGPLGFSPMDAMHLALANQSECDWLITTDDRFIRTADRILQNYRPAVINPVDWLQRRQIWLLKPLFP
jgi:predicted nucleic acid-binding protein